MNEKLRDEWIRKLEEIPSEEWEGLKEWYSSTTQEWWNSKNYDGNEKFDGLTKRNFIRKNLEIVKEKPYFRGFSFPSRGRFGLTVKNTPMSYWANNLLTVNCESVPALRDEPNLTDEILESYRVGEYVSLRVEKDGSILKEINSPLTRYFVKPTPLLFLNDPSKPFFDLIEKYNLWEGGRESFYEDVIYSRGNLDDYNVKTPQDFLDNDIVRKLQEYLENNVYPITHAIAELAHRHKFHGIVYKSVRSPRNGISTEPDNCIALFNKTNLKRSPQEKRFLACFKIKAFLKRFRLF